MRTKWRELETEPRTRLDGHAGGNPGYSQANVLTGHRASSRPYNPAPKPIFKGKGLIGGMSSGVKGRRLRVRVVMPWYPAVAAMTTSAKSGE